jgi:macrolide-specific efflux system membrane fusion protein
MTATANIITGAVNNVLMVSSQAVTTRGNGSTITVITTKNGKDVLTPTPVVVGLVGDSDDQIISGVKTGTKVVLRTVTTSTSTFPSTGTPSSLGGAGLGGAGAAAGGRAGGFGG